MPRKVAMLIKSSFVIEKTLFYKCEEQHKSKALFLSYYREESWVRLQKQITKKGKDQE